MNVFGEMPEREGVCFDANINLLIPRNFNKKTYLLFMTNQRISSLEMKLSVRNILTLLGSIVFFAEGIL